ncbi:MAG TPA: alpha/beta fold hydrolase [Solirubrobacteraceae bacterium]|nr:alpha/beta fold hydrolase [Solirubrobacteraceae bacterium]
MAELSPALYRAGTGEPLVLIHGFTATWRCWLPVLGLLVPRFEVIAPTLHGHDGGPVSPPGAETLAQATDHFESLLDGLGVGTAHLAGNSLGGALALELAKRGRARSVVAISPGGGWEEDDRREVERIIRLFKRTQTSARATVKHHEKLLARPGFRRVGMRDIMARGHLVPAEEAVRLTRSSIRCDIVEDAFKTMRNGTGRVVDLDRIDVPTLIAWGDKDRLLPMDRHAGRFRREIPGVRFEVMRGLGHTPMWDAPGRIAELIGDFAAAAAASANGQAASVTGATAGTGAATTSG